MEAVLIFENDFFLDQKQSREGSNGKKSLRIFKISVDYGCSFLGHCEMSDGTVPQTVGGSILFLRL